MEYLVSFGGSLLSGATIYLVYILVKSKRHGGTVSSISIPALVVALGFFSVSTPKISKLILDWSAKKLEVSKLQETVEQKQKMIAHLDVLTGTVDYTKEASKTVIQAAAAAEISPTGTLETGDAFFLEGSAVRELAPHIKPLNKGRVLMVPKNLRDGLGLGVWINPETGEKQPAALSDALQQTLMRKIEQAQNPNK